MECTRCGADGVMLYPCPHCGRSYCGPHRYPRHGCVTDEDVAGESSTPAGAAAVPARSMDVGEPSDPVEPPETVAEWMRRQTYLTFIASVGGLATVLSTVVWLVVAFGSRLAG